VTREPEWDDVTRNRHLGLAEYHAGVHVGGCGLHESVAKDDPYFTLDDSRCPVCAAVEAEMRARAKRENEREEHLDAGAKRASDGRTTFVRLLRPDEIARLPKPGKPD
jgi:hypothetical protein